MECKDAKECKYGEGNECALPQVGDGCFSARTEATKPPQGSPSNSSDLLECKTVYVVQGKVTPKGRYRDFSPEHIEMAGAIDHAKLAIEQKIHETDHYRVIKRTTTEELVAL